MYYHLPKALFCTLSLKLLTTKSFKMIKGYYFNALKKRLYMVKLIDTENMLGSLKPILNCKTRKSDIIII